MSVPQKATGSTLFCLEGEEKTHQFSLMTCQIWHARKLTKGTTIKLELGAHDEHTHTTYYKALETKLFISCVMGEGQGESVHHIVGC